jgi:hypothetical protein
MVELLREHRADVHDMGGAQAMLTSPSPEAAALMESHGVSPGDHLYSVLPGCTAALAA